MKHHPLKKFQEVSLEHKKLKEKIKAECDKIIAEEKHDIISALEDCEQRFCKKYPGYGVSHIFRELEAEAKAKIDSLAQLQCPKCKNDQFESGVTIDGIFTVNEKGECTLVRRNDYGNRYTDQIGTLKCTKCSTEFDSEFGARGSVQFSAHEYLKEEIVKLEAKIRREYKKIMASKKNVSKKLERYRKRFRECSGDDYYWNYVRYIFDKVEGRR